MAESTPPASDVAPPVVVLVRPQMGENIGAAARVMANFGLDILRIVAPRDGWPNPKADAMASHAAWILDRAQLHGSLAEAVADCHAVFATTARPRDTVKPTYTPRTQAEATRQMHHTGMRTAWVFGPERTGLEAEEVLRATAITTIPSMASYPSLNLAQAVAVAAYEWRMAVLEGAPPLPMTHACPPAARASVEHLAEYTGQLIHTRCRYAAPEKVTHLARNFRHYLYRSDLNEQDVRTFFGVFRALCDEEDRAQSI